VFFERTTHEWAAYHLPALSPHIQVLLLVNVGVACFAKYNDNIACYVSVSHTQLSRLEQLLFISHLWSPCRRSLSLLVCLHF